MLFVILAWFSMFIPLEHVPGKDKQTSCLLFKNQQLFLFLRPGNNEHDNPVDTGLNVRLDSDGNAPYFLHDEARHMDGRVHSKRIRRHTEHQTSIINLVFQVFVFSTLFEFTVVIFLKYYLADLPTVGVGDRIQAWVTQADEAEESNLKKKPAAAEPRLGTANNALRRKLSQISPMTMHAFERMETKTTAAGGAGGKPARTTEEKNRNAEKVVLAIEKFSVIVFLFSFLVFNIWYWVD